MSSCILSVLSRKRLLAHRVTVWATAESGIYYYWIQLRPRMAVLFRTERSKQKFALI